MQLTGKEIIKRGIVSNYDEEKAIQQQGIDLRVENIDGVTGMGVISTKGTTLPDKASIAFYEHEDENGTYWRLDPGYYELIFMEGVNIPDDVAAYLKARSSVVRCGADVRSGQYDAGFHTNHAGGYLVVYQTIKIYKGARIAQLICHKSSKVTNTYNGQFQNDKQRKTKK